MKDLMQSLSLTVPVVQAPMAGVQDSALAIAVSRAGGLGSLPCAMLTPEALELQLRAFQAAGVEVFNINFFCHQNPVPDAGREAGWRAALAPYYAEYGIDAAAVPAGGGRAPFSEDLLELIRPFRPRVVSFHFGLPKPEWLAEIQAWGGLVWSSATTVDEAIWLYEQGVDAVIVQGVEAGGHRGMFRTDDLASQRSVWELLPAVRAAIPLPLIAAGGMASPQKVAAALAAGASLVQVGTAYLRCSEALTTPIHRQWLASDAAAHTELTNLLSGRPARGIVNRLLRELGPISPLAPQFPLATAALVPLRAAAEQQGKGDFSPLWCGMDASGCREVSAAEQTLWLVSECATRQ